jgi:hypothetical protein
MKRPPAIMVAMMVATTLAALALTGCDQPASGGADPTKAANAEKYARDRQACLGQVDDKMKTRRTVDDHAATCSATKRSPSKRPARHLVAYGDNKSSNRLVERCTSPRRAQPQRPWW